MTVDKRRRRSVPFRVLLWDYERGSIAYEVAVLLALLLLLLVPGGFWRDPLWRP